MTIKRLNEKIKQYKTLGRICSRKKEGILPFNFQCSKSGFDWNYGVECCDCGGSSNVPGLEDGKRKYH